MEIHHIMLRDALQFFKIYICNSYDQTRPAVFAMLYSYRQFFVGSEPPNSFRDAPVGNKFHTIEDVSNRRAQYFFA